MAQHFEKSERSDLERGESSLQVRKPSPQLPRSIVGLLSLETSPGVEQSGAFQNDFDASAHSAAVTCNAQDTPCRYVLCPWFVFS